MSFSIGEPCIQEVYTIYRSMGVGGVMSINPIDKGTIKYEYTRGICNLYWMHRTHIIGELYNYEIH